MHLQLMSCFSSEHILSLHVHTYFQIMDWENVRREGLSKSNEVVIFSFLSVQVHSIRNV